VLGIWEAAVRLLEIAPYLLPTPSAIIRRATLDYASLLIDMLVTMTEALAGFLIGNTLGFLAGIVFAHSRLIAKGLYPYAIALKTTPLIALAPLLVVWCGSGLASKIAASALICFFPILVNSVKGFQAVDDKALDLFESLNAGQIQVFTKLRLPNSLPYLFSALRISSSLAVVGAVVGEFVGANRGLGYTTLVSSYHLDTEMMFAATAASALGGVALFGTVALVERHVVFWNAAAAQV
jgi:NitT/TauT family transport system permease protein